MPQLRSVQKTEARPVRASFQAKTVSQPRPSPSSSAPKTTSAPTRANNNPPPRSQPSYQQPSRPSPSPSSSSAPKENVSAGLSLLLLLYVLRQVVAFSELDNLLGQLNSNKPISSTGCCCLVFVIEMAIQDPADNQPVVLLNLLLLHLLMEEETDMEEETEVSHTVDQEMNVHLVDN